MKDEDHADREEEIGPPVDTPFEPSDFILTMRYRPWEQERKHNEAFEEALSTTTQVCSWCRTLRTPLRIPPDATCGFCLCRLVPDGKLCVAVTDGSHTWAKRELCLPCHRAIHGHPRDDTHVNWALTIRGMHMLNQKKANE